MDEKCNFEALEFMSAAGGWTSFYGSGGDEFVRVNRMNSEAMKQSLSFLSQRSSTTSGESSDSSSQFPSAASVPRAPLGAISPTVGFADLETDGGSAAIMQAMVAVLAASGGSPGSSSSQPSVISNPFHIDRAKQSLYPDAPAGDPVRDFRAFGSLQLLQSTESSGQPGACQPDLRPATGNHSHHVMSERRRREKLNDSFQELRMLLPAGTKKDKSSVLIGATKCIKDLEAQVREIGAKNRKLEKYLLPRDAQEQRKADVEITRATSPSSDVHQVNLRVTLMVECDVVELVLQILECLKWMKAVTLLSVDAYTYSQINLFAKASIKLKIEDCDWNDRLFRDAMNQAVEIAMSNTSPCSTQSDSF